MTATRGGTASRGSQGVQGWQPPRPPDNNSSGGAIITHKHAPPENQAVPSQGQSDSSRGLAIGRQGQKNSLHDKGIEQQHKFLDFAAVAEILAVRTAMESIPIASQAVQLRTYANDTLFHMVKFIESTSMLEEIIMPMVLKSFGMSDNENMSSSWAVRTRKGVCGFLSTKRSNVTVDLKTVFERGK